MQDSPHEQVILRDINRTFPAHDFFKEAGGSGQEALYRISKVNKSTFSTGLFASVVKYLCVLLTHNYQTGC